MLNELFISLRFQCSKCVLCIRGSTMTYTNIQVSTSLLIVRLISGQYCTLDQGQLASTPDHISIQRINKIALYLQSTHSICVHIHVYLYISLCTHTHTHTHTHTQVKKLNTIYNTIVSVYLLAVTHSLLLSIELVSLLRCTHV